MARQHPYRQDVEEVVVVIQTLLSQFFYWPIHHTKLLLVPVEPQVHPEGLLPHSILKQVVEIQTVDIKEEMEAPVVAVVDIQDKAQVLDMVVLTEAMEQADMEAQEKDKVQPLANSANLMETCILVEEQENKRAVREKLELVAVVDQALHHLIILGEEHILDKLAAQVSQ